MTSSKIFHLIEQAGFPHGVMQLSGVGAPRALRKSKATGPTAQHLTLALLQDTKVRLGFVNSFGEQKGVDSLIVTDMIALARNRAISDAVLVSGDEDLRVGVQQAQEPGQSVSVSAAGSSVAGGFEKAELHSLIEAHEGTRQVPRDVDRQLLSGGRTALGRDLEPSEKKVIRRLFIDACQRRLLS